VDTPRQFINQKLVQADPLATNKTIRWLATRRRARLSAEFSIEIEFSKGLGLGFSASYTKVYSVIYDSGSVPE